ncbi:MAG: DUF3990 domain-containing protein [Lachnospiraceae bacterium]|nr:DUF3990 domain-containing protein [Lachnospiraceae bacterium]
MILYHTSKIEIMLPDIHYGRKNADFGQGFYLTPDYDFTYRWAWQDAIVNKYELDLDGLYVHSFSRSIEWFEYIFHNRRAEDRLDADIVMGPIANDTIFDTLGIISSGYLSSEEALKLLMIGPEYTQVAVKTGKAVKQLKWLGSDKVTGVKEYKELLKKEKDEYQEEFAKTMQRLNED